ncbi:hypothetical protein V6N13_141275 [Hibiscus sabdariffa]
MLVTRSLLFNQRKLPQTSSPMQDPHWFSRSVGVFKLDFDEAFEPEFLTPSLVQIEGDNFGSHPPVAFGSTMAPRAAHSSLIGGSSPTPINTDSLLMLHERQTWLQTF